jgi:uncharacterized protein
MTAVLRYIFILLLATVSLSATAQQDKDFPPRPSPPRLVNDLANMMSEDEEAKLEAKLQEYERTSSTQITVVTIKSLGSYEVAQYAIELGNRWGVGQKGKDNGAVILASLDDRAVNISTGYGLEGTLTDIKSGQIIRNEILPAFKRSDFYEGFDHAADAIIAVTKGEYKAEERKNRDKDKMPAGGAVLIIAIVYFIIWLMNKFRGGGGSYMSGRGSRHWGGGPWLGGGGFGGGGFGGGSSGGGFGGFGGGSFGGGGASGRW